MPQTSLDRKAAAWSSARLGRKTRLPLMFYTATSYVLGCPFCTGDWGIFFVSLVYFIFMHLVFLFKYLTCFNGEEHDGIICKDCRTVFKFKLDYFNFILI